MQKKTIKAAIEKKMNEWLDTITDASLRDDVKDNIVVSGGCIASMLLNEPVNDFDVYLKDIDVVKRVAAYYVKTAVIFDDVEILDGRDRKSLISECERTFDNTIYAINNSYAVSLRNLKENQIKLYFNGAKSGIRTNEAVEAKDLNYHAVYFSPNAISLSNNVQVVLRFYGSAEEIHKTYDFIHATNYFTFKEGVVTNIAALESILTKQLKYNGSLYPVTSIIRAKKFIKRGFNIGAGELLKIMFQISQLDLSNPDVLEEQIIGIDVAYFSTLIEILRNKIDTDTSFKLNAEYINTLIDKVFSDSSDMEE